MDESAGNTSPFRDRACSHTPGQEAIQGKFMTVHHRKRTLLIAALFMPAAFFAHAAHAEDPWADAVVSYNAIDPNPGFETPEKALGEPSGGTVYAADNSSVHSIGRPGAAPGSYITLRFDTPVTDDPANPMGLDAIVYGNTAWTGGDPYRKWTEPGLIEISEDVNGNGLADDPWYRIPGSRDLNSGVLPEGMANPDPPLAGNVLNPNTDGTEYDWGYCELTPTQKKYLDNYVRPDNPFETGLTPRSGGGDAFDIAWAVDAAGDPAGITQFDFIRISAFIAMTNGPFGYITPEIDAVADVAPDIDTDGDGILDEYETRVAGTDPVRPESTVLALEIPREDGGSPAGAELGTASDEAGNAIALFSAGLRSGVREYNCIVDILSLSDPAPGHPVPGLEKSGAVREFQCSVSDFEAAQIQHAELTIAYTAADIAGLDEPGLSVWRGDGGGFSQEGISSAVKDTEENRVTFRSRYPGIFLLASETGSGDSGEGAAGIALNPSPGEGHAGEPGTVITVTSDAIWLSGGVTVADGTLFTVDTTLGEITTPDADPGTAGMQVAASGGIISFTLRATTTAGTASITALSQDGVLHGECNVLFAAGSATGPVEIYQINPDATAPGPLDFTTGIILDAWGNPLDAGAAITIAAEGGAVLEKDADPEAPGHQLSLNSGVASFSIRVFTEKGCDSALLTISLYADPEETELLGSETFLFDVVILPLRIALPAMLTLLAAGLYVLRQRKPAPGRP
jgi:hypothetical protein